jgi:hypothetical protein
MLNTATATASGRPRSGFFNPETTMAMGLAFERAWQMIQISREPILAEYGSLPRPEELARVILDLARQGEHNPDRLCDRALATLLPLSLRQTAK